MNCKKCGNVLNPSDVICPSCGEPVNPPAPLSSTIPNVATSQEVATPIASTDIAVNPNVVLEGLPNDNSASVSAVGQELSNEPVAAAMANTDIAVNPNVVVENNPISATPENGAPNEVNNAGVTIQPSVTPNQPTQTNEAKPKRKVDVKFIVIVTILLVLIMGLGTLIVLNIPS